MLTTRRHPWHNVQSMPYRFEPEEGVEDGLRRIALEQIDAALEELGQPEIDPHETTHQVRKRCKKLRGLVRLVRFSIGDQCYSDENEWFRDTARLLSGGRDKTALRNTYDMLVDTYDSVIDRSAAAPLARILTHSRNRWVESGDAEPLLARVGERMQTARERVADWRLKDEGFEAFAGGLEKTYRRARKRFAQAYQEPTPERFHEWRKRVKYGWYHMRLLENTWPASMEARRDLFDALSDMLGDHHDLVVFRSWLDREGARIVGEATIAALTGMAKEQGQRLEQRAHSAGELLFAEEPSAFASRLNAYWDAWRDLHI